MSSLPAELAETIQAGHIAKHPDPIHDNAPATVAEEREPVSLRSSKKDHDNVDDEDDDGEDIPYSVLQPTPRTQKLPPLPDLRFEQSYMHSISSADTWWKVLLITTRDQVMMPLAQGLIYNLLLCGWHHWNRNARLHGNTIGVRLRRWWYEVNNWTIPGHKARP